MSPVANDRCLQCGKSRTEVKDRYNSPCATATYGETIEGLDDWERHHWRDWSDTELAGNGILPDFFDQHRRDDIYALPYAPCLHTTSGHTVIRESDTEWGQTAGDCWDCGARNLPIPEPTTPERSNEA